MSANSISLNMIDIINSNTPPTNTATRYNNSNVVFHLFQCVFYLFLRVFPLISTFFFLHFFNVFFTFSLVLTFPPLVCT